MQQGLDCDALRHELLAPREPLHPHEPILIDDSVDQMTTCRIMDANANRAREAFRVLDDYVRFVLEDTLLTRELKTARHELVRHLDSLPPRSLLAARDTPGDVGTTITADGEMARVDAADVARVNLKRLQEALRGLEEYGKIINPAFAAGIEGLRYRVYSLERAIVDNIPTRERLSTVRLCVLLTGSQCLASMDWTIREAATGGATMFQLREKDLDDARLLERARELRRVTRELGVLFIVNDRPDIARLADADGVHLGQDDLPIRAARRFMGPDALIGRSTHDMEQVRRAVMDGADYIGIGPTFPSRTKQFNQLAGLEFIRDVAADTSLPAYAIGGISRENLSQVIKAGARRVAVSAAIVQAESPQAAARELLDMLEANKDR
jgi:thiamine-phosphate pyrophosphorylase